VVASGTLEPFVACATTSAFTSLERYGEKKAACSRARLTRILDSITIQRPLIAEGPTGLRPVRLHRPHGVGRFEVVNSRGCWLFLRGRDSE
jgi:hypothetical protein